MSEPLAEDALARMRQAGLVLPKDPAPGQRWLPRTPAEAHLLRQAQQLDVMRQRLLAEVGRLRHDRRSATTPVCAPGPDTCPLTPSQLLYVAAAAGGESVDTTARRLFVSPHTIRTHRVRALRRLGARDMAHAVWLATAAGWLTPDHIAPGGGGAP